MSNKIDPRDMLTKINRKNIIDHFDYRKSDLTLFNYF